MIDTFHPLYLTPEAAKLDDENENYLYRWFEEPEKVVSAEEEDNV